MSRRLTTSILILVLAVILIGLLVACQPVETPWQDPYPIDDGIDNEKFKDHTTKEDAIDRAVSSMENLLKHLDSDQVSTTGYYVGANVTINTEDGSAFRLNLQANLYTYPYEIKDENGNVLLDPETGLPLVDEEALAKHNDLIRYSDIVLEWFDGATNDMLIGFYFDGINSNDVDRGNDLYLNLQGSKRIFKDFGDSVLYQQLIRLITHFNLETLIGSASEDGTADSSFQTLRSALDLAITTNYKQTLNGDNATIFFDSVNLNAVRDTVNEFVQGIFGPFEDKLDPLSNKYLGFLFSTIGNTAFTTINTDMQFIMTPDENINKEIMTSLILDASGDTEVSHQDEYLGTVRETVPYVAHIAAEYSVRVSSNIVFDKEGYVLYDYGNYEYTGDMYIPMLDLRLDVLLRTDMNEVDNKTNKIFMQCRDLATDDLIIGLYYANELTYLDIQGLQDLYGGVKIEDIGLPKAKRGGFDLADTLAKLFDFVDTYIVIAVDNILYGQSSSSDSSQYDTITRLIIGNMKATMKDENDPSSRATEQIRIDFEMIRAIISQTSETGVDYTTEQLILLINQQFNIDIESLASILGVSVEELLEKSYFYITYDVDEYSIRVEVYTTAEMSEAELEHSGPKLIVRIDLYPQHIGEYVRIVFPSFDNFNDLQDVMTYSGYLEGQFIFASTEEVDLSELLGSFMGDESGLNTPFILPDAADIYFTLYYDQYIRAQILENGRWTRKSRSAFSLYLYMVVQDQITPLARVYANDVSLNTADPVEELGYIWLDYICVPNVPKFKVREDHFVKGFYNYMGYDFENEDDDIVMGLTDIVKALMEDSWATFEPDVIRVTTSNSTIKNFFRVDELIGTISIQIGFRQRVFDIDQLEVTFAMYTVGELPDLVGESVYQVKLHETIPVYFDFGSRVETRDFYFLYDENSIEVVNDKAYYMPSTRKLFMGVMRDYNVRITTDMGTQRINDLVTTYYDNWEPLEPIPTTVAAYYGESNQTNNYDAEFKLHAVYDRNTKYYTVLNDLGYEIVYDLENDLYIIGLGTQYKYDKAFTFLNSDVKYYYKEYVNTGKVSVSYDLGMRIPGWYIVKDREENILYNADQDYYVVESVEIMQALKAEKFGQKEVEIKVPDESTADPDDFIITTELVDATFYVKTYMINGHAFNFDLVTGYYAKRFVIDEDTVYDVLYSYNDNYFFIKNYGDRPAVSELVGSARVDVPSWLEWNKAPYTDIDWEGAKYLEIDWNDTIFGSHEWTNMDWEDMTINGGIFVAYVVIGEGSMATFRRNVRVKVLNREIITEKYVNILTPDGSIVAPVADTIEVDPYIYLLYKAYYENTLSANMSEAELRRGFTGWFLAHYNDITFRFTKIYGEGQEHENTPDEVGSFEWNFDYDGDGMQIYAEYDINNRTFDIGKKYTYVYTVFHNQVVALALDIAPRTLEEIWIDGESAANTYTIDALQESTYKLPTDLTYIFNGADGQKYALDLRDYYKDFTYTLDGNEITIPALFSTLHSGFASAPLGDISKLASANSLPIIKWTNPYADNIKLVNVRPDGKVYPFKDSDTNVTTTFLDLVNYIDRQRNWYYVGAQQEGWFNIETITLTVLAPDKIIATRPHSIMVGEDAPVAESRTVHNVLIAEYFDDTMSYQELLEEKGGIFFVDPYDSSTWILPREIIAFFNGKVSGTYDPYHYTIDWEVDGNAYFRASQDANGNTVYALAPELISRKSYAYFVEGVIGEGSNTLRIRMLVYNMNGYADEITFGMIGDDGEIADLFMHAEDIEINESITASGKKAAAERPYPYQLRSYDYYVNTYARFNVPEIMSIKFADGTVRNYLTAWHEHDPWAPAASVTATTTLGDLSSLSADIALTFRIKNRSIDDIELLNADPNAPAIDYNISGGTIRLNGLYLDRQGYVYYIKDGVKTYYGGTQYKPYEFFNMLLGDIKLTLYSAEDHTVLVIEDMKDAVLQAELPIFGTFDTQKLIEEYTDAYGRGLDIYIGQDKGAHDFRVIIEFGFEPETDKDYIEFGEEQSAIIEYRSIEAFTADNSPQYPDGFIFKDELQFTVTLKSGQTISYGGDAANARPVPEFWSVACPTQEIYDEFWAPENESERMPELTPYEKIDRISWERLMLGGNIWVSTMLEDGSRIYFYLSSDASPIGTRFHSAATDLSPYKIIDGTVTIQNIYSNYPLGNYITPASLPSRIAIGTYGSVTIEKSNIQWKRIATSAALDQIDYHGTVDEYGETVSIPLASATIIGQQVTLYLRVLPADVVKLQYNSVNVDEGRHFESKDKDANDIITIEFDAYHNASYGGNFILPDSMGLVYDETGRVAGANVALTHSFQYSGFTYYRRDGTQIRNIAYDLDGHKLTPDVTSDSELPVDTDRDLYLTSTLRDGQVLKLHIRFLDKRVKDIVTAIDIDNKIKTLILDPYSENIVVPNEVVLKFEEGADLNYVMEWTIPEDFEVKYDTALRYNDGFNFIGTLGGFRGLADIELIYLVKVENRVMKSYSVTTLDKTDYFDKNTGYQEPVNAYYHYTDVFAGKASDLPQHVDAWTWYSDLSVSAPFLIGQAEYGLVWNFSDSDITAQGTIGSPNGYITVTGYVYNAERGQPIAIRVYIDSYNFVAIRRPNATGDGYIIMEGDSMRFIISAITGNSSISKYMVDFNVTSIDPETGATSHGLAQRLFVPEGIDVSSVPGGNQNYRLYWNRAALNEAYRIGESSGPFYFGNASRSDIISVGNCVYQYEMPNVLQLDFGYGMGTQNNAIYVVNPISPDFSSRVVKAMGIFNNEYDISLEESGLVTRVIWGSDSAQRINASYLAGGVIRDFTATIELTRPADPNFIYTQTFEVMLVILDMSPTSYINNKSIDVLTSARVKTNYNVSTYSGQANNPYKDVYLSYLVNDNKQITRDGITDNVLNTAVRDLGLNDATFTYTVTEWNSAIYNTAGTRTQYSAAVNISGRNYKTNIVYRQWNATYRITGLDMGYGYGLDNDGSLDDMQKIYFVVNPIAPGSYTVTPTGVTGNNVSDPSYTFEATWWDVESNGAALALAGKYIGGGIIEDWKVVVTVKNGDSVLYSQIVNITLVVLDMLPVGSDRVAGSADYNLNHTAPKTGYTRGTYDKTEDDPYADNPYGSYYEALELWNMLNAYGLEYIEYGYAVAEWGEPEVAPDGRTIVRSREIILYNATGVVELGRYISDGIIRVIAEAE